MSITLKQALSAQAKLRDTLGLDEENFSVPQFIGMLSDEIEQMRKAGHSDAETARILSEQIDIKITQEDIGANYASPETRSAH